MNLSTVTMAFHSSERDGGLMENTATSPTQGCIVASMFRTTNHLQNSGGVIQPVFEGTWADWTRQRKRSPVA